MIPNELHPVLEHAKAHVFDVDHTLTRHSTGRRFAQSGYTSGLFPLSYLLQLPTFYLRYRLGRLTTTDISREIRPLTGRTRGEIQAVVSDAWERYIHADIYPAAEAYVAACRQRGARLVLASTSFDILIRPLAIHLGIEHTISSELEFRDDVATGWIRRGPCYAEQKERRIRDLLNEHGITVADTAFYSDSRQDIMTHRVVGYPVAVHPDRYLLREARRNRWPIIRW